MRKVLSITGKSSEENGSENVACRAHMNISAGEFLYALLNVLQGKYQQTWNMATAFNIQLRKLQYYVYHHICRSSHSFFQVFHNENMNSFI